MSTLLPGTEVHARGLRWEVVLTDQLGQQTLYRLRALDGALRGRELDLLSPFEPVIPVQRDLRPDRAAPLINWLVYHQAFLLEQALGPDALLAAQPGRLRLEPYQFVPAVRALHASRVRLLLADGVGLGKTIQAGLVLTELIARRVAHRVLVVAPAGPLLEQWRTELAERFGLRMQIINRALLEQTRREHELGANPFDHLPLGLVSIDFLKQEKILDQLERASYDVVVLDEAHHCMDLGTADREDSQRRRLAEVLARRCDSLLLLTATPHDGNDRSFASLCELLDPSLVDGRGALRGERYRAHVIRRLKRHIVDPVSGAPRFIEREVLPRPVIAVPDRHPDFIELQRQLLALIAPELRRAFRQRRYSDVLVYLSLLKRSVSTARACRETLTVVTERYQSVITDVAETQEARQQRRRTLQEAQRRLDRFGTLSSDEEQELQLLEAEELARQLVELQRDLRSGAREQARHATLIDALHELIMLASTSEQHDPKLDQLLAEVQTIRAREPGANILIYTEYTDSQRAAVAALAAAEVGTILTMSGEDSESARLQITERFRSTDGLVLVSTDAAAEGLNLHQRCHHLIHLELPFNPNRLEQRNGRIDRFGQTLTPIVRYLYLRGTFEERILLRLIAKYERQRRRLTFVPNTLGLSASSERASERLLRGLMHDDEQLFQDEPQPIDFTSVAEEQSLDEATRELLEEVDRSLKSFEQASRTHSWLGDIGLGADQATLQQAQQAQMRGRAAGTVDLGQFVLDAVRLDGGEVRATLHPQIVELRLPNGWEYGLADLPGYDRDTRIVRLTTDMDVTSDLQGRQVGYLGRAHPLVRRALDRVRQLSFGGSSSDAQDIRASAVAAAVVEPQLVFTFLGRVESDVGRELEQVLSVSVTRDHQAVSLSAEEWLKLADPERAIRTTKIYEQHFQTWFAEALDEARSVAAHGFEQVGREFIDQRRSDLEAELQRQDDWLRQRADEIAPIPMTPVAQQLDLFSAPGHGTSDIAGHGLPSNPQQRLAAFQSAAHQSPKHRSEAEGVLRIYHQRTAALAAHLALRTPEVVLVGVLMIVPRV